MLERWLYTTNSLEQYKNGPLERTNSKEDAVLRSSELKDTTGIGWLDETAAHAPALDIDLPCELVPSSTEGHYHLYIDKPMSWENYKVLLTALLQVGVIEQGFFDLAIENQATYLRVRDKKFDPAPESKEEPIIIEGLEWPCDMHDCELCQKYAENNGLDFEAAYQAKWV